MKPNFSRALWARLRAGVIIGLACLLAIGSPAGAAAVNSKRTDQQLYAAARQARQKGDYLTAALNLYAYRERQPEVYLRNDKHRQDVDETLRRLIFSISDDIDIARGARKEGCKAAQVRASTTDMLPMYLPEYPTICQSQPLPDEVILYLDFNYGGRCVIKPIGRYPGAEQIGLPNDSISSLKVGRNVRVILCEHHEFNGVCSTFLSNDSNLSNDAIGNDRVTSAWVERR